MGNFSGSETARNGNFTAQTRDFNRPSWLDFNRLFRRFNTTTPEIPQHSIWDNQMIQNALAYQVNDLLDQMKSHIAAAGFKALGLTQWLPSGRLSDGGQGFLQSVCEMHGHCQVFFWKQQKCRRFCSYYIILYLSLPVLIIDYYKWSSAK